MGSSQNGTVLSRLPCVAIIDDDRFLRDALANLVRSAGFEALTFTSGDAFLARMGTSTIDVILTDFDMPGIDGVDLIGEIRSRGVSTPVIVMTAQQSPRIMDRARNAGAKDFLSKPFDADRLIDSIEKAIASGKRLTNGTGHTAD